MSEAVSRFESLWCLSGPVAQRWEVLKKLVAVHQRTGQPAAAVDVGVSYRQADKARLDALVASGMAECTGSSQLNLYEPTEFGIMFIRHVDEITDRWSSMHGKRENKTENG